MTIKLNNFNDKKNIKLMLLFLLSISEIQLNMVICGQYRPNKMQRSKSIVACTLTDLDKLVSCVVSHCFWK